MSYNLPTQAGVSMKGARDFELVLLQQEEVKQEYCQVGVSDIVGSKYDSLDNNPWQ